MKGGRTKSYLKYNLLTSSGELLLPGRHVCNCEASKHALINNCLNCGRIVCEQEGSGPCFTCGELVCSPKEQEQISRMSKTGCKLYKKLMSQTRDSSDLKDSSLQDALSHRDKLLEYDRTVERRMKVIDDQNDYFQTDSSWLSQKQKETLNKQKQEVREIMHGRKKNILTFDLKEKKVIEEKPVISFDVEELLKPDISIFECENANEYNVPENFVPIYGGDNKSRAGYNILENAVDKLKHIRIQDRDLQEMSDDGMCLSLHQPYASLLTAGIKKHEGRDWYTNHRGRLWIHSAGKVPNEKTISEVEKVYISIFGHCKFPESYPTGCLLGCVDIVDCLPQEEYNMQFPEGEIASPYVFICENASELTMKFPMRGKHKIFKLDSIIHQAAKKTLRKSA